MNTRQAASRLNVTVATICNWIRDNKISAYRGGYHGIEWIIDDEILENYLSDLK